MPDIINVGHYEYDKAKIRVILDKKTPEWTPVIVQTPDGIYRPVQVDSEFKGPDAIWRAINAAHHLYLCLEANKDKQAEGGHWFGVALNAGSYHAVCIRGTDDEDIAWEAVAGMLKAYLADEPFECDATIYGTAPHNWGNGPLFQPKPEIVQQYTYNLSIHPFEPLGGKSSLALERFTNAYADMLETLMRSDLKELPPSQLELPWVDGVLALFDGTPPQPLPSHSPNRTISETVESHFEQPDQQREALRSMQEELDNLWQSETAARLLMLMKSGEPIIDPSDIDDDGADDDDDDWDDDDDDEEDNEEDEVVAPDAVPVHRWMEEAAPMTDEDWERIAAVFGLGDEGAEKSQKNDSATPSEG